MSRTLDATQSALVESADIRVVPLVTLTVYTDRGAETGATTYYISDRLVRYDFGNTSTVQEFLPWLEGHPTTRLVNAINHLPTQTEAGGRPLRRPLTLVLQNLQWPDEDSGERLAETLAGINIDRAKVVYAELLVDALTIGPLDLSSHVGDEHTVLFRGIVKRFGPITNQTIQIYCETEIPQVNWVTIAQGQGDARDTGTRVPKIYGTVDRVRCPAIDITAKGILSEGVDQTQTVFSVEAQDGTFSATGDGWIEGERISWTSTFGSVTRGDAGTAASVHPAGAFIVERGAHSWAAHDEDSGSVSSVWTRNPYNGELVLLDSEDWTQGTDTVDGVTVTTIDMSETQFDDVMAKLQQLAEVTQQPGTGTTASTNLPNDLPTISSFSNGSGANFVDGSTANTESFRVSTNDTVYYSFGTLDGPITAMTLRVYVTSTGSHDLSVKSAGAGDPGLDYDIDPGFSAPGWWTQSISAPNMDHRHWKAESSAFDSTGWVVGELERSVTYDKPPTPVTTNTEIGAGTIGYRLDIFAKVSGIEASGGLYTTANGTVIESQGDALRHWIISVGGLGASAIDDDSFEMIEEELSDNYDLSLDMRAIETWEDGLNLLAYHARANVFPTETATGTVYVAKIATFDDATNGYGWETPTEVIDVWQPDGFIEQGRDGDTLFNRFEFLHGFDPAAEYGSEWASRVVANKDDNDMSGNVATAIFTASEAEVGPIIAPPVGILGADSGEAAYVDNIAGYFVRETMRTARTFTIEGVHWAQAYALQPGDLRMITPPWSSTQVPCRVLEVSKNPGSQQFRVIATEILAGFTPPVVNPISTSGVMNLQSSGLDDVSTLTFSGVTFMDDGFDNRCAVVLISSLDATEGDQVLSSVVWDAAGVNEAFTLGNRSRQTSGAGDHIANWFAWLPGYTPLASKDVTVTFAGTNSSCAGMLRRFYNVDQTTPVEAQVQAGTATSGFSEDITTLTDNGALVAGVSQKGDTLSNPSTPDFTQESTFWIGNSSSPYVGFQTSALDSASESRGTAGTHTIDFTSLGTDANVLNMIALRKAT